MITLQFPGMAPKGKERPRYDSRGGFMHMPQRYIDWKSHFGTIAVGQYPEVYPLVDLLSVAIEFRTTTGNMRPDVDNAAGSCLDALQDAGVIANDSQVRRLLVEVVKAPRSEVGITVTIQPIDC